MFWEGSRVFSSRLRWSSSPSSHWSQQLQAPGEVGLKGSTFCPKALSQRGEEASLQLRVPQCQVSANNCTGQPCGGQLQRPDPVPTLLPQSSIQIAFEEVPQLPPRASISHVTCIDQSECTMVRV